METGSYNTPKPSPAAFIASTVLFFALGLSAADSVGFVPYYVDGSPATHPSSVAVSNLPELGEEARTPIAEAAEVTGVLPSKIVIPAIDLELPVQNTKSRDMAVLDEALHAGPVRHMDSARLGEEGNTLIFGHSSHLPVVKNQMYKAFNRVPELVPGDAIRVSGEGREFLYSVISVKQVDAEDAVIDLSKSGTKRLTIVTCDTLTGKSARFVLEAELVGEY